MDVNKDDTSGARDVGEAYRACEAIARREGRNFHWGFRFLPREKRSALCALYAFARATDDIVDEMDLSVSERAARIAAWRADLTTALNTGTASSPILEGIAMASRAFDIPRSELFLLIEGCESDLSVRRYESMEDTAEYCRKVAVTVGMAMLAIFQNRDKRAIDAMTSIGHAFQLTNILRDIPEDFERDRIYIPLALLRRHGVVEEDLKAGRLAGGVRELMRELIQVAVQRYDEARELFRVLDPSAAKTMKAMWRIYRGILLEIKRRDGDVWSRRPGLSTTRKAGIIIATSLGF